MAVDAPGQVRDRDPAQIALEGVAIDVPARWEARISRRADRSGPDGAFPVLHASTIPLPNHRGDYGSNVVERLGPNDVFVSLVEFGPEAVDTPLFPRRASLPRGIEPDDFHHRQLQRVLPGQAGKQIFFTFAGRAFCLYVVIGSIGQRIPLAERTTELVAGISVAARE